MSDLRDEDELDSYENLLARMEQLAIEWDEEGPVGPYERYQREADLERVGRFQPGSTLERCPECGNRWRLRDVPCARCRGIGTIMCTKVIVKDGLV